MSKIPTPSKGIGFGRIAGKGITKIKKPQPAPTPTEPVEPTEEEKEAESESRANLRTAVSSKADTEVKLVTAYTRDLSELEDEDGNVLPGKTKQYQKISTQRVQGQREVAELQSVLAALDAEDEDGDSLFTLENMTMLLLAASAGVSIAETVDKILNSDDIEKLDVQQTILESTKAATNPEVAELILNASFRDQAALRDLENLTRYGNQFGSLSNDLFNDKKYGEFFGTEYDEFLNQLAETRAGPNATEEEIASAKEWAANNYDRDRFLTEFLKANPTHEASGIINDSLSRMGQLKRSSGEIADIDRAITRDGYSEAAKFYQPESEGGYGFSPEQFRSDEQNGLIDHAMGLAIGPEATGLRQGQWERVQTKGELEEDTMRDITANAMSSVSPELQAQQNFGGGGIAKAILNTSNAKRDRLMEDESSLFKTLTGDRQYAPQLGSYLNQSTVDPARAMGLAGQGATTAGQNIYNSDPTSGMNYDPTSGYYASIIGQNSNIDQANKMQPSLSDQLRDLSQDFTDFKEATEKRKRKEQG